MRKKKAAKTAEVAINTDGKVKPNRPRKGAEKVKILLPAQGDVQQNFEGLLWGPIALTTLAHYMRPKARAEDDTSSAHRLH